MPSWVVLLRAINLGARNKVSMPVLREVLHEAGFAAVRTYVQSGNVLTDSDHEAPEQVAQAVRALIATRFDLDVPVVVRRPAEVAAAIAGNPFPQAAAERPKLLHVVFLDGEPKPEGVARLAADVPDTVAQVRGSHLYVDYAGGMHGSRLTPPFLARRLGVDGTARNWRTTLAVAELAGVA